MAVPADLYARILARADLSDSGYVSSNELGQMCEESYYDLYDFLVDQLGDEGPWERMTISTVPNQDFQDVLIGVYRILRLEFAAGGSGQYLPVSSLNLASDPVDTLASNWADARSFKYFARRGVRISNDTRAAGTGVGFAPWRFYFSPVPSAVFSLRLYYLPPPAIIVDNTGVYTQFPDDYPEYVVADVCAKIMDKQEADSAPFVAERERIKSRIERYSKPHQMNGPKLISNMRQYQGNHEYDDWRRRR